MKIFFCIVLLILTGSQLAVFGQQYSVSREVDSLEEALRGAGQDTVKVNLLNELSQRYSEIDKQVALNYAGRSLWLAELLEYHRGIIASLSATGNVYLDQGMHARAMEFYERALFRMERIGDRAGYANFLDKIGIVHKNQGNYAKAVEFTLKSLHIREEIGDSAETAICLNNIGIIYWYQHNYDRAIEYYQLALKMERALGNQKRIATLLGNIGIVHLDRGDPDAALEFYHQALAIKQEMGLKGSTAWSFNNIGVVYEQLKDYGRAVEYYLKAMEIYEDIGAVMGKEISLNNIAIIYGKTGKLDQALKFSGESLKIAGEIGDKEGIKEAVENLARVFALKSDYTNAVKNLQMYSQYQDSLFNDDKAREIGKLEAGYDFAKKEDIRTRLELKALHEKSEREARRNNLQYSAMFLVLVTLLISIFTLGRFNLSERITEGVIFLAFLLFFEFSLVLLDPYIERYSGGEPAFKLLFNAVLAGIIFPLHSFFETKLKDRLVNVR